jgi:hypothetical protein
MFYDLLILYESIRDNNQRGFIDFSRQLVVFFSKFLIRTSTKTLIDLLEGLAKGSTTVLLRDLCQQLPDLENNRDKKLVNYAYCAILNDYHFHFDTEILKFLTKKLITHLTKFNKYGSSININDNMFKEDCIFEGNSHFTKILNAEIRVKFKITLDRVTICFTY